MHIQHDLKSNNVSTALSVIIIAVNWLQLMGLLSRVYPSSHNSDQDKLGPSPQRFRLGPPPQTVYLGPPVPSKKGLGWLQLYQAASPDGIWPKMGAVLQHMCNLSLQLQKVLLSWMCLKRGVSTFTRGLAGIATWGRSARKCRAAGFSGRDSDPTVGSKLLHDLPVGHSQLRFAVWVHIKMMEAFKINEFFRKASSIIGLSLPSLEAAVEGGKTCTWYSPGCTYRLHCTMHFPVIHFLRGKKNLFRASI